MRTFILLLLLPFSSIAKVVDSAAHGFQIEIESQVNTDKATAYQQFLNVGQWWNADHTWFGQANNLTISLKVDGCFCELAGDKQAEHMTVSYIDPNNEIRMVGGLGPLQMMGVTGGMSWKFDAIDASHTKITFHYQVSGYLKGGLIKLAPIVNKVQQRQISRLTSLLNTGSAETLAIQ